MSLLLPLLLAQVAAAAPPPPTLPEDTIVVLAQQMRSIDVSVGQNADGQWQCSLSPSTGNGWVDDRLCRITTGCVQDAREDYPRMQRCIDRRRDSVIDELREVLARGDQ